MNYSPNLQNDDRGDAAGSGPRSTFQVLASIARSGLSTAIAIAPTHEGPPTFDKAWQREKWHREQRELREQQKREATRVHRNEKPVVEDGQVVPMNWTPEENEARRELKKGLQPVSRNAMNKAMKKAGVRVANALLDNNVVGKKYRREYEQGRAKAKKRAA